MWQHEGIALNDYILPAVTQQQQQGMCLIMALVHKFNIIDKRLNMFKQAGIFYKKIKQRNKTTQIPLNIFNEYKHHDTAKVTETCIRSYVQSLKC